MPTAQATLFCTSTDVEGLLSALGLQSRLDDDQSGVVDPEEDVNMQNAREYAAGRVRFYCEVHYDVAEINKSWVANEWAIILAAYWLSIRRGNTPTDALKEMRYGADGKGGVEGDLLAVRKRQMYLDGATPRHTDAPFLDNYRNDARFRVHQSRLQPTLSDRAPSEGGRSQRVDLLSARTTEP